MSSMPAAVDDSAVLCTPHAVKSWIFIDKEVCPVANAPGSWQTPSLQWRRFPGFGLILIVRTCRPRAALAASASNGSWPRLATRSQVMHRREGIPGPGIIIILYYVIIILYQLVPSISLSLAVMYRYRYVPVPYTIRIYGRFYMLRLAIILLVLSFELYSYIPRVDSRFYGTVLCMSTIPGPKATRTVALGSYSYAGC